MGGYCPDSVQLLQQLHNKITRKLSPAKSVDPLTVLPVELAELVLEYLAFRHLVNCMRVNKGWRDYIAKLPRLWMHLDLSGARKAVPRSFIDKAVRRSECRLTRVTIHRFEHVDVLKNVAKVCKNLGELEFITLPHTLSSTLIDIVQCTPNLKKFIVHPEISPNTATQLLRHRPNLEHVRFSSVNWYLHNADWKGPFDALKSFSMTLVGSRNIEMQISSLLQQTPILRSLTLSTMYLGTSDLASLPLTSLVLKRITFPNHLFPALPASLQKLVIEYDGSLELRGEEWTLLQSGLPALTHLGLSDINMLSADRLEKLLDLCIDGGQGESQARPLEGAMPLQYLAVRGLLNQPTDGLFKDKNSLFARSPRILTPALQTLDIATLPCDDDEIECLLTYDTGLTSIDLSSTHVTGASIKMLVDKLKGLKTIRADNCPRINGRDAIEYAIRKGVQVTCSMGEGKGSRKIRYG